MKTYKITNLGRTRTYQHLMQVGDATTINFDFSPWVEDNATVTACTWTLKSGDVSLGTPSLASNVSTCVITAANETRSRINLRATSGSQIVSVTLRIRAIEPKDVPTYDYGYLR